MLKTSRSSTVITKSQAAKAAPKIAAAASGILLSFLSTSALSQSTQLGDVLERQKLIVAATPNNTTVFKADGFMHGYGHDLSKSLSDDLGVEVDFRIYNSQVSALKAVKKGTADVALTTASQTALEQLGLAPVDLTCGNSKDLYSHGLDGEVNWSFADATDPLAQRASSFACSGEQVAVNKKLASFYDQSLMKDSYNRKQFELAMSQRLPAYQASFKNHANLSQVDWQLLVAMGYQESHLKADAVSPTGVRGIMMLTSATARSLGVTDRVDPNQSIKGGATYLKKMKQEFGDVPNPDRIWFSLAAYNMGPGAVKGIQRKVAAQGKDPNRWINVYDYLTTNASSNSRYRQCIHYVTRIRAYLENLKQEA